MTTRTFPGMYALRLPNFAPPIDADAAMEPLVETAEDREPEAAAEPVVAEPETTETEAEPAVEEPATEEEPAAAAEGAAEVEETDEDPEPATRKPDWRDKQIIKARAAEKKAREEAADARKEAEAIKALYGEVGEDGKPKTSVVTPEQARKEALDQVRQETYVANLNKAADDMFDAGEKAFPKSWVKRVTAAAENFAEDIQKRPDFLEAVTGLDNGAAVYHELSGDMDRFEAVLQMPPAKMGIELAKISAKLSAKPAVVVSKVPAPITPLTRPTTAERSLEDLANDPSAAAQVEFNRRMDEIDAKRAVEMRNR